MKRLLILGAALCSLAVTPAAHATNVCAALSISMVSDLNLLWAQNSRPLLAVAVSDVTTVVARGDAFSCHMTVFFRDGSSRTGTLAETATGYGLWVPDNT